MRARHGTLLALAALLPACGGDPDTGGPDGDGDEPSIVDGYEPATITPDDIDALADFSAPQVFTQGFIGMTFTSLQGEESSCPVVTETETETRIEGDCTDDDGRNWHGEAVSNATGITYTEFGYTGEEACDDGMMAPTALTLDGRMALTASSSSDVDFDVELTIDTTEPDPQTCETETVTGAIDYTGHVQTESDQLGEDGPSTWNGSGEVGLDGLGRVAVSTSDEHLDDDVCESEAVSGRTTITSDTGDEAIIRYDGASDCDPEGTATWSLNGTDQGELSGVRCAIDPRATGSHRWALWLGVLAGLAAVRRRR